VIDTHPSPRVHNHTNGRVFLRVLDRDQPLNADETMRVAFGKGQASYEAQLMSGATLEAVDQYLVREYARLRGLDQPVERILTGLNLLVGDTLTIATTASPAHPSRCASSMTGWKLKAQAACQGS
jgi:hypothetical protein